MALGHNQPDVHGDTKDGSQMNTRFEYLYRDGENYKQYNEVVIEGEFTLEQLQPHLYWGQFFMPSEVGLEDLQQHPYRDCDHVWHELCSAEPTWDEPTIELNAGEIVSRFCAAAAVEWETRTVSSRMMELTPDKEIVRLKRAFERMSRNFGLEEQC